MLLTPLTAISPLDGRYAEKTTSLQHIASEYGLIRLRVFVEVQWLLTLIQEKSIEGTPDLSTAAKQKLIQIAEKFTLADAQKIKEIERTTNHDIKAVEYFLQQQCEQNSELKACIPFIHFGCTSEDINNLAYALMLTQARDEVLLPTMTNLTHHLQRMAHEYAEFPLLSRTHGQPASPTTLGKEYANFGARLKKASQTLKKLKLPAKINGAVGNFNAHVAAYPKVKWLEVSKKFIQSLGLTYNEYTTQIEPHDGLAEWLQTLVRFNNILIDYCRDIWGYISLGYIQQKVIATEIGSSTMPHKVNPIDFENAEGNLGIANALANHLINKLPISRWQRDLTDSTVLRNLGSILGYALIAYQSLEKGHSKIAANKEKMTEDLLAHPEIIAEGIQSVLRRYGINEAYEQLKSLTRGKKFDTQQLRDFIQQLSLPETVKNELQSLTPTNYLGYAIILAKKFTIHTDEEEAP